MTCDEHLPVRYAIVRCRHPQDWHDELLIAFCGGQVRRWSFPAAGWDGPATLAGAALTETTGAEAEGRRRLRTARGPYEGAGFRERVEAGPCEVVSRARGRLVLRLGGCLLELGPGRARALAAE